MKKNMKRFISFLLVLVMAFAMSSTVFAENADITITASDGSTRTYEVYQIFTGDYSENDSGKEVLSNVKWGRNGKETEGTEVDETVLAALKAVNDMSDTEKLDIIKSYVDLNSEKFGTVSDGSSLTVPTGYYLIKDNGPVGDGEAYSLYVVEVVGPTTISPKVDKTTSEKKVQDVNDSTGDTFGWQDSADYDIGDMVPFQLKATIAQDYANYKAYKLTFHDKEETGLTFDPDSVKVYVNGSKITTGYEVVTEGLDDGDTFEVRFADLKGITSVQAGLIITVEYESRLNENANIGSRGNKNTMHITYSNNPNDEQAGENGKTPNDTVIVFTYKTVVNKVTENPDYDASKDSEKTGTDSDGNKKYVSLKGAGFTLYKKNATSGKYEPVDNEVKGNEMTTFVWEGLDDGDYKLVETTTPAGYNTIKDIEFTISAEHNDETLTLTALSGGNKFTGNVSTGEVSADVENKAGATLPETGGMGTTLFYIVGGILVVGAAVLLITKRRMNSEK